MTRKLRKLLATDTLLPVPGIYDALSARIAKFSEFEAVYMTGYGTAAAYGYPDFGLLTMTEMVENLRRITDTVDIPVLADADTGYGNPINVYRTVRQYEKAGAAAIQLEDQTWPKRCGHMEGKHVIEANEMVGKIKATTDARVNADTVLIIRTDAIATHGFSEAVSRAHMYVEAGADVLFIEALSNTTEIEQIPQLFKVPCLINMGLPLADWNLARLREVGYRIALYPTLMLIGTLEGCLRMCKSLHETGQMGDPSTWPFDFEGLNRFLGIEKYRAIEQQFGNQS